MGDGVGARPAARDMRAGIQGLMPHGAYMTSRQRKVATGHVEICSIFQSFDQFN